ncbi:MAG: polysaccharide pyruvyl transferase family protein [Verrucomicrobiae bacterium]|nr:polysaccharide pyruvyl transferase family protein [Verrucomicrobiae bacterium]MDW8343738.1 polysaccharide pyruvyl transferase family protein [Verrucomicrobiae bacterium]
MRIGILTFHHVVNYGAVMQAYALARYVRGLGHAVETIDYRPAKALAAYEQALFNGNPHEKENRQRAARIEEFVRWRLSLSPQSFRTHAGFAHLDGRYDTVIAGSDEIWNLNSIRGFDSAYFLDFAGSAQRIAYAASFGFTNTTGAHREKICALLRPFLAISVRDASSQRILREECGLTAAKVLDPTLLLDGYDDLAVRPKESGFILVYANCTAAEANFIRRFAEQRGKPVIAVAYPLEGAINRLTLSPEEWLGHFAAADYVFNGFFHGVVFSILYRKPFTAFASPQKIAKIGDLLNDLGLSNRIVFTDHLDGPLPPVTLDYAPVEARLASAVRSSRTFLQTALAQASACVVPA